MKLSGLFKVSLVASALVLAGCGGDINVNPTNIDNSVDNSVSNTTNPTNPTTPDKPEAIQCASYTQDGSTFAGAPDSSNKNCIYSQAFASNAKDLTTSFLIPALKNGGAHIFEGALFIGKDVDTSKGGVIDSNGPTLTIEAGATIAFTKPESFVRVGRGSKILAQGEIGKPITFTSISEIDGDDTTTAQIGDWGGVQVNGRAPNIECTLESAQNDLCNIKAEGIVSHYGGNNADDNSGVLKHVVIKYAGFGVEGDELNGLTLNAVGSGTTVDYVHVHKGFDDGIEVFGGTVNLKHIVITESADDGLDWDSGWQGKGQFILVQSKQYGNHGFETDGAKKDPLTADGQGKAANVSFPTISNATVVTTGKQGAEGRRTGAGMEMKEWGKVKMLNVLFVDSSTDAGAACLDLYNEKDLSGAAGVHANAVSGDISFSSAVFACGLNFENIHSPLEGSLASFNYETWFKAGANNHLIGFADFSNVLGADGVSTKGSITDKDGNVVPVKATPAGDSFFTDVSYIGAIGEGEVSEWADFVAASMARAGN